MAAAMEIIDFLFRWSHVLFGIAWVGLLYYFNFVQTEYFKEAEAGALADAKAKLAPRALKWFVWSSKFTLLTGLLLLGGVMHKGVLNEFIVVGIVLGTLMAGNAIAVIWPKQKIVLGIKEGDATAAAAIAGRASRTNVLFSAPMLFCMLASPHLGYTQEYLYAASGFGLGMYLCILLALALEANALFGKLGPLTSIRGVIRASILLSAIVYLLLLLL